MMIRYQISVDKNGFICRLIYFASPVPDFENPND